MPRDALVRQDANSRQRDEHDRELHHQPKRQHQRRDEPDVLVDGQQRLDAPWLAKAQQEREGERNDQVADGHANREERECAEQEGPYQAALSSRQTRRHEAPELEEDDRHRERDSGEERDLDPHAERAADGGEVELLVAGR